MCNRKAKTPIWKAIADALRSDLAEGRYAPGDKLPTETALAERFGVNRHTVRHGVSALVDEGLIRTRRGSGAFVAATPTDYPIGKRVRFHENLLAAGREPGRKTMHRDLRAATADEAQVLAIVPGAPVVFQSGISLADGQPLAVSESLFPLDRLPGMDKALDEVTGVTAALRKIGVEDYMRASTRLTAVRADATQALHLQVEEGAPLLRSTSLNVNLDGDPIEFGRTWFAGDRITLTLEG